jgi:tryptophan-rich sensory protein
MPLLCAAFVCACSGQVTIPPVPTGRMDNQRTGQNINETLLTPANVNSSQFGALFNYPIDYQALAQPLYVPGVTINGVVHNVVYVATMADSVYAFDADSNAGANASPLWWVNFTDIANNPTYGPVPGISLASIYNTTSTGVVSLPCAGNGAGTVAFFQEGIVGTPAIDTVGGTLYVVAKTLENGAVVHRLHALDITSGAEKFGGPVVIKASSSYVSPITGKTYNTSFNSLHQLNRPGLLLLDGVVYIAFGSNSCNDDATGWVLSYDANSLAQIAAFNTSPEHGLASVWQTGNGIAADENNNLFFETGEACGSCYDVKLGGATYSNSVVELDPNSLTVTDFFTPYDVQFLNQNDEDLSATGVLILPDQAGSTPHELVAGGKEGFAYVLNRDSMGAFEDGAGCDFSGPNPTCDNVLQEFSVVCATGPSPYNCANDQPSQRKDVWFSSPAYWNNTIYVTPNAAPALAYPILPSGLLGTPVPSCSKLPCTPATAQNYVGAHSPSVSANGNANGIVWLISGNSLNALDAVSMKLLYSSSQVKTRDTLPKVAHYATQTVVNGKVYIATADTSSSPTTVCTTRPCPAQLSVYGLLTGPTLHSGGNQNGTVGTMVPIQVQVVNPYSGSSVDGLTVTFSAKSGTFNPSSGVSMTNSSGTAGIVSTNYTLPTTAGVVTITASVAGGSSVSFTETAVAGTPTKLVVFSGNAQSGQAGSILPKQLEVKVEDVHSNVVPGVTVTFVDKSGLGTLNPTSGVTNASGIVATSYQLPNTLGAYKIIASVTGGTPTGTFAETATGDAPASLQIVSGNNQSADVNTALSQPLVVQVSDSGGNPITGVTVVFSAPSGTFSGSPATTNSSGQATVNYTTGNSAGPVTITAAVDKLNTQISTTVTAGPPASVTVTGGNNHTATAGTTLPQALTVVVADQYSNPVFGGCGHFSDGGAGGSFSFANPVTTTSTGTASQSYTLPPSPGPVTISATAVGVTTPAMFSETGQ